MFKVVLIAILCQMLLFVHGQDTFSVSKGPYNDAGTVIAALKMNALYIGVDNPVDIAVPGVLNKEVTVKLIGNGSIEKGLGGSYNIKVKSVGKIMLAVSVKGKEISRTTFRVKRIPDPTAIIGGVYRGGIVKAQSLAAQSGIIVLLENFDFEMQFRVKGFTMNYSSNAVVQSFIAEGPRFSDAMKACIKAAKSGDVVTFSEIVITGPDMQLRQIADITFTII